MRVLTKYFLPATLVAGFLFCFIQTAFFDHFPNTDDYVYDDLVQRFGITETIKLLFRIDTGRWLSHLIVGPSFYFLGHDFLKYGIFLTMLMAVFIASIVCLYKNYSLTFLHKTPSLGSQLIFSFVSAATLFFLLFEGRQQNFSWVSSSINHLLSVTLCVFLAGLLFKETKSLTDLLLIIVLGLFIGGSNEVNAVCMIPSIAFLFFFSLRFFPHAKLNRRNMIFAVVFIIMSLILNISSGGYEGRMNGLPSFNLYQSIKNTIHSFLMPFLNYMYLPIFLGAWTIYILCFKQQTHHYSRRALRIFGAAACVIAVSFFLNCFLLSDVVPARAALWAYTLAILTVGLFLLSNKKEAKAA